jgi:CHAD domain-containing protein
MAAPKTSFLIPFKYFKEPFVADLEAHGYKLRVEAEIPVTPYTYFDTQGGQLFGKQYRLRLESASKTWQLIYQQKILLEQEGENSLGEGALAKRLSKVGVSDPLLPHLKARISGKRYVLETPSGSEIALLFEQWSFANPFVGRSYRHLYHLGVVAEKTEASEDAFTGEGTPPDARQAELEVSYIKPLLRDLFGLKAQRYELLVSGLRRIEWPLPGAPIPRELSVQESDSIIKASSKILARQAYKMWANTQCTILDLDPEFLHDLRVATRRARFALRMAKPLLNTERRRALRKELSWIARKLGKVRDIDVFLRRLHSQFGRAEASEQARRVILELIEAKRAEALVDLRESLETERYSKIIESLRKLEDDFVVSEYSWRPAEVRERADFSPRCLAKRTIGKALRKISRWPADKHKGLSIPELHQIRIDCKRLRYTCEFFDDILGKETERLVRPFVQVQDCLGDFNDAHAAAENLVNLADSYEYRDSSSKEVLLALGALVQIQRDCAENYRANFLKIWEKLPKQAARQKKILSKLEPPADTHQID